ncbi:MAG: cell division protein FtsQ/DivIB [Alphaproteobacteria bacterium]|nr:cell division protein FtsQ/DivIB [Alphaproteobacteria bacterium]
MHTVKLQDVKSFGPFATAFAVLLLSVLVVWFLNSAFYAEKKESFLFFLHNTALTADLRLNEVYVRGRFKTSQKELLDTLHVERGMPITAVDLQRSREALQRLPWVKTVHIERRLPHILYVQIKERIPVAVWQNKGVYRPVDSDGQPIETFVKKLNGLPLVLGTDAPEKTPELLTFLAQEPELNKRVKAAVRKGQRRWDILLDDIEKGITVRLPEKDPASAWGRLANLDRTEGLLSRKITLVDLRQPDKLIVRLEEPPTQKSKKKALPASAPLPVAAELSVP